MKFGGSVLVSPGDHSKAAQACQRAGDGAVAVVSAMKGVTDALLAATARPDAVEPSLERWHPPAPPRTPAHARLARLFDALRADLAAHRARPSPYLRERILSYGERISAQHLAAELQAMGSPVKVVDAGRAGVRAAGAPPAGRVDLARSLAAIRQRRHRLVAKGVTIVPGFYGRDARGRILTLGRGASDLTAALLARALDAEELHFIKDVEGVYEADPRRAPDARLLPVVGRDEARAMASQGEWVLHAATLDLLGEATASLLVRGLEPGVGSRILVGSP